MCGRFDELISVEQLVKRFGAVYSDLKLSPRYNIAPTQEVPVIINDGLKNELKLHKWGLIPSWSTDPKIGHRLINACSETVHKLPSFKSSFYKRRCLVPATGFYEWSKDGKKKTPLRVILNKEQVFAMAGLWSEWVNKITGEIINSFTIITVPANDLLQPVHDRMPAILEPKDEELWLDKKIEDIDSLRNLLRSFPSKSMRFYEVSSLVNSPKNDTPEIIKPIDK